MPNSHKTKSPLLGDLVQVRLLKMRVKLSKLLVDLT